MKTYDEQQYPHADLTARVIASAKSVHEELRPGLDEKLYERALCIEFADHCIHFAQQKVFQVFYKSQHIGNLIPDLIAEDSVIVDLKVVEAFTDEHVAQMLGYLNITGLEIGLLINFKHARLQIKRIANLKSRQQPPTSSQS
jgi:GxxExxY protein